MIIFADIDHGVRCDSEPEREVMSSIRRKDFTWAKALLNKINDDIPEEAEGQELDGMRRHILELYGLLQKMEKAIFPNKTKASSEANES